MTKLQQKFASLFMDQFIDWEKQKADLPDHVVYNWVHWLYRQWCMDLINLSDYRKLLAFDILKA